MTCCRSGPGLLPWSVGCPFSPLPFSAVFQRSVWRLCSRAHPPAGQHVGRQGGEQTQRKMSSLLTDLPCCIDGPSAALHVSGGKAWLQVERASGGATLRRSVSMRFALKAGSFHFAFIALLSDCRCASDIFIFLFQAGMPGGRPRPRFRTGWSAPSSIVSAAPCRHSSAGASQLSAVPLHCASASSARQPTTNSPASPTLLPCGS